MADGFMAPGPGAPIRDAAERRPLFRALPPAPEFPVHALGPLREAAEAVRLTMQAPAALCAQSVLGAAALSAQAHRDVLLPGGGRKPLTAMLVTVAESGERKSSADKIALTPVHAAEERWRAEAAAEAPRHRDDHEAWREARAAAAKRHKGDRGALRDALAALGGEPKALPSPMLLVADPTPEGIVRHLSDGRPWGGLFTAEGGLFLGGHGFGDDSRMRTAALLNALWDGEPVRRSRASTGATFLPGRRFSAHVMAQPAVADRLLGDAMLDGIGLLARVLLAAPESAAGTRLFREPPDGCERALAAYNGRIGRLLALPPATDPGAPDALAPPALGLAPAARRSWVAFHDECERAIGAGGALAPVRALGAKLAEHAGRLAAVLAVYADPEAMEVPDELMGCGIELALHYAAEALRLQGAAAVSPDLRLAARLLAWWRARPDRRCHLATVYQRGLNAIGDAATARRMVAVLEDHGWVLRLPPGTVLDGRPRREAWELAP